MPLGFQVIDIHVHVTPWRMLKPAILEMMRASQKNFDHLLALTESPKQFVELLDEAGVEKAGLINYISPDVMGFTEEVNEYVSRYCREFPDRLIAYGSVHPKFSKDAAAEMDRLVNELGIRAIKIHPPHQLFHANDYREGLKALEIVYSKAQRYRLPVMIHTGTSIFPGARNKYADPMDADDVAIDFPDLKLILAHGGRPLYTETAFFLVRRHKNVYLDISSIPPRKLLEYFPRIEQIADKCMFGSDWPAPMVPSIRANIEQFAALPISDEAKRKILRETALKVFAP